MMRAGWVRNTGFPIYPVLATLFVALSSIVVAAKPLDNESCTKIVDEFDSLRKSGVEKAMDSDPAKAKENMSPQMMVNIERYLFLEGQLRFRCPHIKLSLPGEQRSAETDEEDKKNQEKPKKPAANSPKKKPISFNSGTG